MEYLSPILDALGEVGEILLWIVEIIVWVVIKVYESVLWVHGFLATYLTEGGATILIFSIIFFAGVILWSRFIAGTQEGIESFFHGSMGMALKIFGIFIVMVIIIYILQ